MALVYEIPDDFYDDSFLLVAIHSVKEDHKIVYGLNKYLKSKFKRVKEDFYVSENKIFPWFEWLDPYYDCYWTFIANTSAVKELLVNSDLFKNESTYTFPKLIPEYKEVQYFLKIADNNHIVESEILKLVTKVPEIITAYAVDANNLKSKNNLTF